MRITETRVNHLGDRLYLRFVLEHLAGTVSSIPDNPNLPAGSGFGKSNTVG